MNNINDESKVAAEKQDKEKKVVVVEENYSKNFNLPFGMRNDPDISSEEFWESLADEKINKRKHFNRIVFLLILVFVLFTLFVLMTSIKGRGWITNIFGGDKKIQFTLPLADIPDDEKDYETDSDGKYTAKGVAEALSDSIVTIEIFKGDAKIIPESQGSGIIMTDNGYILTNAHVVSDADEIRVVLNNKLYYAAKIVGIDNRTDIALIKIPAEDLKPVSFADSDKVTIGDEVVAIGSPAGLCGSITKGIVSGIDRKIKMDEDSKTMSCIQVDAAINPGNSGGALVNMWGQVIGITSSKISDSDYYGIGFAISTKEAKPIIEELMEKGYIDKKARIGISFYFINEQTAELLNIKSGLWVKEISEDCDVSNTDLRIDDIITEIDGEKCTGTDMVQEILNKKNPGDEFTAKVYRYLEDGEYIEFEISFKLMEEKESLKKVND